MSTLLDPALLMPLLALLVLTLPRTAVFVMTCLVCLFSRDRGRRAEARRLLQIISRTDRGEPPS